jgi:starvation-inducible DNA-binding protein
MDTGISAKDRATIANSLSRLLADTYVVYLKTHNFHWNVEGPMFQTLHQMFMEQYTEAWNAIDLIAERIRSLGHYAPGTYRQYLELARVKETPGVPKAEQMVKLLIEGQEAVVKTAGRGRRRSADARLAHAAHADAREERLDAAFTVEEVVHFATGFSQAVAIDPRAE